MAILKRQNTLYQQVALYFEKEIREGRLPTGAKLPTTMELSKQFEVNPETIQLGLKILMNQGLICRAPKRGTFVMDICEEKTLGIVFPVELYSDLDAAFFPVLFSHLTRYAVAQGWKTRFFATSLNDKADIAFYELRKAINAGELAGIAVVGRPSAIIDYLNNECPIPILHHLQIDRKAMIFLALERLLKETRSRIDIYFAVHDEQLNGTGQTEADAIINEYCDKFNCSRSLFHLHILPGHHSKGYQIFKELWTKGERPEAVVVTSDAIFRGIWYAIMELHIAVPDELKIITHVNKGLVPMTHIPLTCLEVSPQEIAEKSFNAFCRTLNGEKIPKTLVVPHLIEGKTC